LHIPNLILKLKFIQGICVTTDKMVFSIARAMERTRNLVRICRDLNLLKKI
jgi:hypothetical protein